VVGDLCTRCQDAPLQIDGIRSVFYFEGVLRAAVHHLKYRRRLELAEPLGGLMASYWARQDVQIDIVVPVPLHGARLRERGYNQADLLAREMARQARLPFDQAGLSRSRPTAPQVGLDAAERKANVRGAFCCPDGTLTGKQVLLVDDVCTTGATLEACAQALYAVGATGVQALTLARAR
jgi:ComF family protein